MRRRADALGGGRAGARSMLATFRARDERRTTDDGHTRALRSDGAGRRLRGGCGEPGVTVTRRFLVRLRVFAFDAWP